MKLTKPLKFEEKLLEFVKEQVLAVSHSIQKFRIDYGWDYIEGKWDENTRALEVRFGADTSVSGARYESVGVAYDNLDASTAHGHIDSFRKDLLTNGPARIRRLDTALDDFKKAHPEDLKITFG